MNTQYQGDSSDNADRIRQALRCGKSMCRCRLSRNVHCPHHDDKQASLTIDPGEHGAPLVHCKAGCDSLAIIQILKDRDLWPDVEREEKPPPTPFFAARAPDALYTYTAYDGTVAAQKGRWNHARINPKTGKPEKDFLWAPGDTRKWGRLGFSLTSLPLWHWEQVQAHPDTPVIYVEGENCVLACEAAGLVAVTNAGGSSTKSFGDALEILRDRDVILFPDNDDASAAYMVRVYATLRDIAKSVRYADVAIQLPPTGDAVEYFALGGTAEDLMKPGEVTTPIADTIDGAIRVRYPCELGLMTLEYRDIETAARHFDCDFTVSIPDKVQYAIRVNFMSTSSQNTLRMMLESLYSPEQVGKRTEKTINWTEILVHGFTLARAAYHEQSIVRDLTEIPYPGPIAYVIGQVIPEGSVSVVYGPGSASKTYLLNTMIAATRFGIPWCGYPVVRQRILFIDYENNEATFVRRMTRVYKGYGIDDDEPGFIKYFNGAGASLNDQVEKLRAVIKEFGITLVVLDSIAAAIRGKPEDGESTNAFFNALSRLGAVTIIVIAHTAKPDRNNPDRLPLPFGSVFVHTRARMLWYVSREDNQERDSFMVTLSNAKANDSRGHAPIAVQLSFEGDEGPVRIIRTMIGKSEELRKSALPRTLVWDALTKPMTKFELSTATGLSVELLGRELLRLFQEQKVTRLADGKYVKIERRGEWE